MLLGRFRSGVEPSRAAADYSRARGLTVINDFFSAAKAREHGPFDAISMSMVLEHVRDPIGMIEEVRSLLVPGGLLFVASPALTVTPFVYHPDCGAVGAGSRTSGNPLKLIV